MKLTTSEVQALQREWAKTGKICNHDKGWGIEQDDTTGCKYDCFCIQCGMRHTNEDFLKKERRKTKPTTPHVNKHSK